MRRVPYADFYTFAPMKTAARALIFATLCFVSFSVGYVLILKVLPVGVTPLQVARMPHGLPRAQWVPLEEISPRVVAAVIASEDNNFLTHHGFDWQAIRQAVAERQSGGRHRGASTISQQTAKNVFCYPAANWLRKGFETWYTLLIEALWSKRRIMEAYLNVIELGEGIYGVEAASQRYFGTSAARLTAYQASLMAAVLPNPRRMKLAAPSAYVVRRAATIRRMVGNLPPIKL